MLRSLVLKNILLLVVAAFLMMGCKGEEPKPGEHRTKRIILIINTVSPFWDTCRAGMKEAEKNLKLGDDYLKVVMVANDGTAEGQITKLQQYGTQTDIAAIGISVIDKNNVAIIDEMKKLRAKGIPVITIDNDINTEKFSDSRYAYLGSNNIRGGNELGKCAKLINPKGGGWVSFVGTISAQNASERVNGFEEGTGGSKGKFHKITNMDDGVDSTKARENVRNAISNHSSNGLTTLVGIWSYNAPAIVDVVRDLNRRKDFTIVTYDAEPGAIKEMDTGMIDAMVVQNPYQMGYEGVRLMTALVKKDQTTLNKMFPNYDKPNGDIFTTDLKVIVPDEKSIIWKNKSQFHESTEVLTLETFKTWLKKYHLTGS